MTPAAEDILEKIRAAVPGAGVTLEINPGPAAQHSLVLGHETAHEVVRFLRDDPELGFDYLSNATGVDWPGAPGGKGDETGASGAPGCLEAVCHLYSVGRRSGPLVVRMRTEDREHGVRVPSLTPLFKSAEFQEREIYDLYGVRFDGHPDLRRLLMWENFVGHPMRKDYVMPDDYDYEPTPHDGVAARAAAFDRERAFREALEPENGVVVAADAAPPAPPPDQSLEVSLGPQHPSTHGVFRMNVALDGETVTRLKPVFGYLHRNHEQIAETAPYLAAMPYTDRLDYFCAPTNNWAYALAVEKLAGIEVPERAEYIRVILAELTRILNHTCFFGFFVGDMGGWGSVLMYAFREREKILDLFEALTGSRMMTNCMRFGGCRSDLPPGWIDGVRAFLRTYPRMLDEIEQLTATNEILVGRTRGVGVVSAERAVAGGLSGPVMRASGVNYDVRKADGYGIYGRFGFRVPVGSAGDCYDRFMVRFMEIRESLGILEEAVRDLPEGPWVNPKVKPRAFRPPVGEAYGRIEAPKGELGFYLISDGSANPYRYRVRPPSLINLTLLEEMCIGARIADVMVILGSIDIVLGEVDR
jgi:NADH-quinone oxidoreductase subunit D